MVVVGGGGLPSECVQRSQPLAGAGRRREDVVSDWRPRPARRAQLLKDDSYTSTSATVLKYKL